MSNEGQELKKPAGSEPRIVASRLIRRGRKFNFASLTVEHAGGRRLEREIVRHPGAVVVVPVLKGKSGGLEVVLIRNYRVAVGEWLLECCAGTIEREARADGTYGSGEDPAACAARELVEETGYRAGRLRSLGWFYTTPGLTDERMHAFLGADLSHVGQRLEEDEAIEVVRVPVEEAVRGAAEGRIRDGKSMVALRLAEAAGWSA